MSSTITLQTLPSGRLLAICKDGEHSNISIQGFEPKTVWPQDALERVTAALVAAAPSVQTNAKIIKFPVIGASARNMNRNAASLLRQLMQYLRVPLSDSQ
jgi:hypothetical protein